MITDHLTVAARPGDHLDTIRRQLACHTCARTLAITMIIAAGER